MCLFDGQQQQREEWRNGGRIKLAFRSRRLVEQTGGLEVDLNNERNACAGWTLFVSLFVLCSYPLPQLPALPAKVMLLIVFDDNVAAGVSAQDGAWRGCGLQWHALEAAG